MHNEQRTRSTMISSGMSVRTAECAGGNKPSEDRIFHTPGAVIVLDGESNAFDVTPSGGWYAHDLGEGLAKALTATPDADLRQVLEEAIGALTGLHGLPKETAPAASVSMVRQHGQRVDALVLAHNPVVAIATDETVEAVRDDRAARVITGYAEHAEYRARLRAGHGFDTSEHRELLERLSDRQMRHINREGGYWMAHAAPEAARHAVARSWPAPDLTEILIMTDGVSVAVEEYGLTSWADMARVCRTHGPALVLDKIRDAELADHRGLRWPREKISDDKALAAVTFSAAG
jgi:hypothetical protein